MTLTPTERSPLRDFQYRFMQALFAQSDNDPAWATQAGFAVYRQTVMKACIDALEANYPAVARLVGSDWFRSAAALHVADHLPEDPRLMIYGAQFPAFLGAFEAAAEWPYLALVARLDRRWTESSLAPDAASVDSRWLGQLAPDELAATRLRPHPATQWDWFADHPIYSIWAANRSQPSHAPFEADAPTEFIWQGEGALLTRTDGAVTWSPASEGTCAFLSACRAGATLAEAAGAALDVEAGLSVAALLSRLLRRGALQR